MRNQHSSLPQLPLAVSFRVIPQDRPCCGTSPTLEVWISTARKSSERTGRLLQLTPKKLPDQVRDAIRLKHYADSTEHAYVHRTARFTPFQG